MKWTKQSKYHAIAGKYTMSWNDVGKFTLYSGNKFIESGTKEECLEAFNLKSNGE